MYTKKKKTNQTQKVKKVYSSALAYVKPKGTENQAKLYDEMMSCCKEAFHAIKN